MCVRAVGDARSRRSLGADRQALPSGSEQDWGPILLTERIRFFQLFLAFSLFQSKWPLWYSLRPTRNPLFRDCLTRCGRRGGAYWYMAMLDGFQICMNLNVWVCPSLEVSDHWTIPCKQTSGIFLLVISAGFIEPNARPGVSPSNSITGDHSNPPVHLGGSIQTDNRPTSGLSWWFSPGDLGWVWGAVS